MFWQFHLLPENVYSNTTKGHTNVFLHSILVGYALMFLEEIQIL